MSVTDGQSVSASVTNNAFMSRLSDTSTVGVVDLQNVSYTHLIHLQRVVNEMLASLGMANQAATDAVADDYSSNTVVTNGDNRKVAIGKLDERFTGSTGHSHDGTDGEGAQVSASNLADFNNLFTEFGEYTSDAASGTSIDVSSLFSGQTAGGDASTAGVITSAPINYVALLEKTTGGEIEDGEGDRVFGRLTESSGTWTLSFYTNKSGTETAHSLSSQDIRFLYREVFTAADRPTIGANVGVYDTQSAVGDIPDASATQRGVVSTGAQTLAGVKEFSSRPTTGGNDIVDVSASQVLTNKDYDGGTASNTSRVTLPKDTKANLDALTRKEATLVYATDDQKPYYDDGTQLVEVGSGAGSGGGLDVWHTEDFETTVAADFTSGNSATFDNGGTLQGTLSDNTTTPVAGASSLRYVQAAGSLNDWVKSPLINIDDKQSGNTSGVTLYHTYTGNPGDIQFIFYDNTGSAVLTASEDTFSDPSNPTRFVTSVSIPSNSTVVAYGFQVKVENIGATLDIDDVEFSTDPFVIQNLINLEDWESFTPTGSWTTNTNYSGYKRRVGDQLHVSMKVSLDGAPDAAALQVNLPTGLKVDPNKLNTTNGTLRQVVGQVSIYDDSTGNRVQGRLLINDFGAGTERLLAVAFNDAGISEITQFITNTAPITLASGDEIFIEYQVPIEGWTSSSPALVIPSKAPRTYSEANGDFTITGTNWTTTYAKAVPYKTSDGTWRLKFNIRGSLSVAANNFSLTFSGIDVMDNQAIAAWQTNVTTRFTSIARVEAPNLVNIILDVASTNFIYSGDVELTGKPTWADPVSAHFLTAIPEDLGVKPALYVHSSSQTINDQTETRLNFGTAETDQDGLVTNASSDWTYTAPKDGIYDIETACLMLNVPFANGDIAYMRPRINGVAGKYFTIRRYTNTLTANYELRGSLKIPMSKGDQLQIWVYQDNLSGTNVSTNTGDTFVSITREQTPVSFGGDIRQESIKLDATGSGNFTGGEIEVSRVGNQVTVQANSLVTHASLAQAVSATGFLPSWARPSVGKANLYNLSSTTVRRVIAQNTGQLVFDYVNWSGGANPQVNTGSNVTLSYIVD